MKRVKKSVCKKMAGFLGAAVMAAGLLVSTPVHAASYVEGPVIDNVKPYGEVGYNSSSVSAYTRHKIHIEKKISLTAYASCGGYIVPYGTVTNTGTDSNIIGANFNMASPCVGIGGKATHTVNAYFINASWSDSTNIGYYE